MVLSMYKLCWQLTVIPVLGWQMREESELQGYPGYKTRSRSSWAMGDFGETEMEIRTFRTFELEILNFSFPSVGKALVL